MAIETSVHTVLIDVHHSSVHLRAPTPQHLPPPARTCPCLQVVDQLYENAAAWVDTSALKQGACRMIGLPNAHGLW